MGTKRVKGLLFDESERELVRQIAGELGAGLRRSGVVVPAVLDRKLSELGGIVAKTAGGTLYSEALMAELMQEFDHSEPVIIPASRDYPLEITESLQRFREDYPGTTAFVMMRFGKTAAHGKIVGGISNCLEHYGIAGLLANDKEYHHELFSNVLTYMHGCTFGIAIFERLEDDEFNPNVSLEVGYMRAIRKHVCLLKDQTLKTLPTDLVGALYREFDPQDPSSSIQPELEKWLRDKDIITL